MGKLKVPPPPQTFVPPPPAGIPNPQLAQGLAMPQFGQYQQMSPQADNSFGQIPQSGGTPGIGQPATPMIGQPDIPPMPTMPTPTVPNADDEDTPEATGPNSAQSAPFLMSQDPALHQKMLDLYNKQLDSLGNAGQTKDQERSNRALSLMQNIIAPAMMAFGKGGVQVAGAQLMQQAKGQILQKQADYQQRQQASLTVLKSLNDMSKIDNDAFHKQVQDNLADEISKQKQANTKQRIANQANLTQWKAYHEQVLAHDKAQNEAIKQGQLEINQDKAPGQISLNNARASQSNAQAATLNGTLQGKQQVLADKHLYAGTYAEAAKQEGLAAQIRGQQAGQPKPVSDPDVVKMNAEAMQQYDKQNDPKILKYRKTMNPNFQPPTLEQIKGNMFPPNVIAKEAPTDTQGMISWLKKYPIEKQGLILQEVRKLHGG